MKIMFERRMNNMDELKSCKENCAECIYHDVFWEGSGCNLLNNGERCKFENRRAKNGKND